MKSKLLCNASILVFLVCFLGVSCSLDYGTDVNTSNKAPSTILYDSTMSRYEEGKKTAQIDSSRLEQYSSDEVWLGENIFFKMFSNTEGSENNSNVSNSENTDTAGQNKIENETSENSSVTENLEASGKCTYLWADLKNKDYRMLDGMEMNLHTKNLRFMSQSLRINEKSNQVLGTVNDAVTISQPDGTVIKGYGFSADMRTGDYFFKSSVSGSFGETGTEKDKEKTSDE